MKRYGYGIVDKNGRAWWDESCVCEDRAPLSDQLDHLNDDPDERTPYRVVALYIRPVRPRRRAAKRRGSTSSGDSHG